LVQLVSCTTVTAPDCPGLHERLGHGDGHDYDPSAVALVVTADTTLPATGEFAIPTVST